LDGRGTVALFILSQSVHEWGKSAPSEVLDSYWNVAMPQNWILLIVDVEDVAL